MQLYVIETACPQPSVLKALRNSKKLGKIRIHQKGDQFTKNKVVEIGEGNIQFT